MHTPSPAGAMAAWQPTLGARVAGSVVRFRVWAPEHRAVTLVLETQAGPVRVPMDVKEAGYFSTEVEGIGHGCRYRYDIEGQGAFPDPASRFQPDGVHGASEVVDPSRFAWSDTGWSGLAGEPMILYELHVGAFTPEGTFRAAADRLVYLRDLGITAVELMPVAAFPGRRNWGYDGVALFAPSHQYGVPDDLRFFVDRAHALGLAVVLDVVYNHVGPDGAYLYAFSPYYFTDDHPSPWGASANLDGRHASEARGFFIENALHWVHEYHVDGLRLDATHAMHDDGPRPFLAELAARVHDASRHVAVIAEDHRNLDTIVRPVREGGWGLDGVWADDLHHQLRVALAGDQDGYYADYSGRTADIATTISRGWYFTGEFSHYLGEPRGTDPGGLPYGAFVVCLQNHDQIGNRALGERLHHQVDPAAFRAVTVLLLLVPETPLIFMGQEWGTASPFLYFTDHHDELGRLVTEGRRREFARFAAFASPDARARIPDPQAEATFLHSRLDWAETAREPHAALHRLHRSLLQLRRSEPALRKATTTSATVRALAIDDDTLLFDREADGQTLRIVVRLRGRGDVALNEASPDGVSNGPGYRVRLTSEDRRFAPDPLPPGVRADSHGLRITFQRPSAVILERT